MVIWVGPLLQGPPALVLCEAPEQTPWAVPWKASFSRKLSLDTRSPPCTHTFPAMARSRSSQRTPFFFILVLTWLASVSPVGGVPPKAGAWYFCCGCSLSQLPLPYMLPGTKCQTTESRLQSKAKVLSLGRYLACSLAYQNMRGIFFPYGTTFRPGKWMCIP